MTWQIANVFSEFDRAHDLSCGAAVQRLIATQRQLADVIGALTDEQYARKPVAPVSSSVGGHVRHCLDHVESLLTGAQTGKMNYDERRRGTNVETERFAALEVIQRQESELKGLAWRDVDQPLALTALLAAGTAPITVATSLGRELTFVLSHTVHHSALVAVIVKLLGTAVPERFGWAPATIDYQERVACAR